MTVTAEQELVLLLARLELLPRSVERVRELLSDRVRWADLAGQLFFQRVAGLAYHQLVQYDLTPKLHRELRKALLFCFEGQRVWHQAFTACVHEVASAFSVAGFSHAFLKGTPLSQTIYPPGTRMSNDSDVLVAPGSLSECVKALEAIGYIQGTYDRHRRCVIPASRKEKLFARMSQYELIPFVKIIDNPFLPAHEVDVNFSLALDSSGGPGPDIDELLGQPASFEVNGVRAMTLPHELFLLQLCVHFFKEASSLAWITVGTDLGLYKLVDIHEFVRAFGPDIDWERFIHLCERHRLADQAYYALHFTAELYGPFVPPDTTRQLRPADVTYLEEYTDGTARGSKFRWQRPFRDRLFAQDRAHERTDLELGAFGDYRRMREELTRNRD